MALLPRITGFIRSLANITSQLEDAESSDNNYDVLCRKRRHRTNYKAKKSGLTWECLVDDANIALKNPCCQVNPHDLLKELLQLAHKFGGDDIPEDVAKGIVIYLITLLKDCDMISKKETTELMKCFGMFSESLPCRTLSVVKKLMNSLPSYLQSQCLDRDDATPMFGQHIKFVPAKSFDEYDLEFVDGYDVEKTANDVKFSLKYDGTTQKTKTKDSVGDVHNMQWLNAEVTKSYFNFSVSVAEMCNSIVAILNSSNVDEELQGELFDLLGFERFSLIQSILLHRRKIIRSANQIAHIHFPPLSQRHQGYGCQVTVESEEEKMLRKQLRRDAKRYNKDASRPTVKDIHEIPFDPSYLRKQREEALISAMQAPMFSSPSSESYHAEVKYPNVYDSQAKAKQSASFIAGCKLGLPEGFRRNDNSLYEEVSIPANKKLPVDVGGKIISVSELDEIGRVAFLGMKTLNKVQSTVFKNAYHSNDNLLICAPTGAGKTNVAMLAVVNCIKQHMERDVIQRDKFKIVYVAPMKALAAEMVSSFGRRLKPLGIVVKELTGDMKLSKMEIMQTQMLVTTPEKWDVVTRKSTGDVALTQIVKLLIIDEVHLLHGDRGPVLEALVARTIRQVESTQSLIRIIGLSATLPNYIDVARFLRVNPQVGLYYFDSRFRPVPLEQTFIGVKAVQSFKQMQDSDEVCYEKSLQLVRNGHQVMVFVHARFATVRTAMKLREFSNNRGHSSYFSAEQSPHFGSAMKQLSHSRNKQLKELFSSGFGMHNAGMLRSDRSMVEKFFSDGLIRVLVCTATLAWGVNLPARAVIIKGTEIYDSKHGSFVDLGILDVMQIFGRAGRPQFDNEGQGFIITSHDKLAHYLSLLTNQYPIESSFNQSLTDNLNAEICLGTVSNVHEAVEWLGYTYLYVRMKKNPHVYGVNLKDPEEDNALSKHCRDLIVAAAKSLENIQMIRYDEKTDYLFATDLGRTASHYYIKYDTIELFDEELHDIMTDDKILAMVSKSHEFEQLKVRDDELNELDNMIKMNCRLPVQGGSENTYGKVNILLQSHISRSYIDAFSLVSDRSYVTQNAGRIIRALFEVMLKRCKAIMTGRLLSLCKVVERQMWDSDHPLRQFDSILGYEIMRKIEDKDLSIDKIRDLDVAELGVMINHKKMASTVKRCANELPMISIEATIQPITRSILRIHLDIIPEFNWNERVHGNGAESFWIWVEDPNDDFIYHYEYFVLLKKQVVRCETQSLVFTIPVSDPLPSQYYVKAVSDRWLGSQFVYPMSFQHLILPERHPPHTELLDLQPLPVTALNNPPMEMLYTFSHFNPIQTQLFHSLYHTDCNILLGAPTGSGKTIIAEIAMFRMFREYPGTKCVYVAPMKALVRERIEDWKVRLGKKLGLNVVELTGDVTPDVRAIAASDVIVTTPEKWDGVSRSWQTRNYVQAVGLIVIDEIHLLGEDRGPVLEVIVSRTNFISAHTERKMRIIGLSTAIANARDLADWLGIESKGLFNFRPAVRPVPVDVHIDGFPGRHYCPRMATMNKPTFQAIKSYSPRKPALVFVSSRRQTRMTALDLIAYLALEDDPRQWLQIPEHEMDDVISTVKDNNLKLTLAFGIGMHHAGLQERDRKTVEELFVNQKIQVLIATSTLAWGVNFPAHLVVIKGTEYFDGKLHRYVDFPVTDVLQMVGRAGRPQYDDHAVAVVLVQDVKKHFYKKFLYEPFPVESSLLEVLPDHMNAEIVAGTIKSKQEAMDYLTWTYFFRRLLQNPSYYKLESIEHSDVNKFLSDLIDNTVETLDKSSCVEVDQDMRSLFPTVLGRISSYYYLSHLTAKLFKDRLKEDMRIEDVLEVLTDVHEYEELPVRHNEDNLNGELAKSCPLEVSQYSLDSPHVKAHLLLQSHFSNLQLPIADYYTDLKSVLDQAIRIIQAMIDVSADQGWLSTTIQCILLLQMVVQGRWYNDDAFLTLPHVDKHNIFCLTSNVGKSSVITSSLPGLMSSVKHSYESFANLLRKEFLESQIEQIHETLASLPILDVVISVKGVAGGETRAKTHRKGGKIPDEFWIEVAPNREYSLDVILKRLNSNSLTKSNKAIAPKFPKSKDEGWMLVLGDVEHRELLALKRVGFGRSKHSSRQNLSFYTPEKAGRYIYCAYVFSDCYVGLDQQYDLYLEVKEDDVNSRCSDEYIGEYKLW